MGVRVAWRVSVVVVAVCLASVVPAGAGGGDVLWKIEGQTAGLGLVHHVTEDGNRVLAVGMAGRFSATESPKLLVRLQDAATGTTLWSREDTPATGGGFANHAILKGARAYVTGVLSRGMPFYDRGFDSVVRVYDAHTGSVVWEDRTGAPASMPLTSTYGQGLVFAGGRLFAAMAYYGPVEAGTIIRAYDAATGRVLWEQIRRGESLEDHRAMLAVSGHVLFALVGSGETGPALVVRAHNAATGAPVWEDVYSADGSTLAKAAIANVAGRVFVLGLQGADFGQPHLIVRSYDGTSGTLLWQDLRTAPWGHTASAIATAGSYVFAAGTFTDDFNMYSLVRALDTYSGAVLWEATADLNDGEVLDMAVIGDRLITVGMTYWPDYDVLVRAYDIRTGAVLWQDKHDVAGGVDGAMTVSVAPGRIVAAGWGSVSGDATILMRAYAPR
jgi:outer membrane protein assembly factor BamB